MSLLKFKESIVYTSYFFFPFPSLQFLLGSFAGVYFLFCSSSLYHSFFLQLLNVPYHLIPLQEWTSLSQNGCHCASFPHVLFPRIYKKPKSKWLLSLASCTLTSGTSNVFPKHECMWGLALLTGANMLSHQATPEGRYFGSPNTLSPITHEAGWLMNLESRDECALTLWCALSACQMQNIEKCMRHWSVSETIPHLHSLFVCHFSILCLISQRHYSSL